MEPIVARAFRTPGVVLVLGALTLAIRLEAQTGLPARPFEAARSNGALTATLVSNDATHLVVQADDGSVVTFVVDGTSSVPAGLVPGSRVSVRYEAAAGNRYRVASVGIPKIPLEPGTTTEPPPTAPEEPEATPSVRAGASLKPAEPATEGPLDASATPEAGGLDETVPQPDSTRTPAEPESSASPSARAEARGIAARADAPGPELNAGRDAFLIGAGLVVVALALGLLLLMRR